MSSKELKKQGILLMRIGKGLPCNQNLLKEGRIWINIIDKNYNKWSLLIMSMKLWLISMLSKV